MGNRASRNGEESKLQKLQKYLNNFDEMFPLLDCKNIISMIDKQDVVAYKAKKQRFFYDLMLICRSTQNYEIQEYILDRLNYDKFKEKIRLMLQVQHKIVKYLLGKKQILNKEQFIYFYDYSFYRILQYAEKHPRKQSQKILQNRLQIKKEIQNSKGLQKRNEIKYIICLQWIERLQIFLQTGKYQDFPGLITHFQLLFVTLMYKKPLVFSKPKIKYLNENLWNLIHLNLATIQIKLINKEVNINYLQINPSQFQDSNKSNIRYNHQSQIESHEYSNHKLQQIDKRPKKNQLNIEKHQILESKLKKSNILVSSSKMKNKPKPKRGMANMGNTCYMNSVLQCLHKTKEFSQRISKYHNHQKQYKFINQLKRLNNQLQSDDQQPIYPISIKKMVEQYNPQYLGDKQNDVGGFINTVFSMISEESNSCQPFQMEKYQYQESMTDQQLYERFKIRDQLKQNSMIDECITGRFKTTYRCQICNKQKRLFQKINMIYLPLPDNSITNNFINFNSCIKKFQKSQKISDWKCSKCEMETPHQKTIQLFKLNKILIFCLKRFNNQGQKIKTKLQVQFLIDLKIYLKNKYNDNNDCLYKLYAVINHYGSVRSGHYTCFCQNQKENVWVQYDDSTTKIIPDLDSKDLDNAYILFYHLIE